MPWQDRITGIEGSFRGARFLVRDDALSAGRRVQVHQYPKRDIPYAEDLGRKAREFTVECYVIGPDYDLARDRLIGAIEQPGAGILVHPLHGTMRATVTDFRKSESTSEQNTCRFTITFVEAGDLVFPSQTVDTASKVHQLADEAQEQNVSVFSKVFSVAGQPEFFVTAIEQELDRTLGQVTQLADDLVSPVAREIRAPFNMASAIVGSLTKLRGIAAEPLAALKLYQSLFTAGDDSPAVPVTTGNRRRQASNTEAMHRLMRRGAVIEGCRAAADAEFASRDDALAERDRLLEALDTEIAYVEPVSGWPIADDLFQALSALRAAVVEDIRVRGAQLARLTRFTPRATLPALVVAHQIYGDARRADEIVARNKIRHPGFITGGETLEVLIDG